MTPAQESVRLAREASLLLDRLTKLARGRAQYARLATSMFTPATEQAKYRDVSSTLGEEFLDQIAALDIVQARQLLALALDRAAIGDVPAPSGPAPAPGGAVR